MTGARQKTVELDDTGRLTAAINAARHAALAAQHDNGHWCHELEADCTIPAEYVLMLHYFGEREPELEAAIARYLRRHQLDNGGWPLYESGDMDISCSVKAYYALKLVGDSPDAPHMQRARQAILDLGGAARANVFTRITLALFEQVPWRAVPTVPVELVLFPTWFPVHLLKVSYWSRTVVTPLAILCSLKPRAANPLAIGISELFTTPADEEQDYFGHPERPLERLFLKLDGLARHLDRHAPGKLRQRAIKRAEEWIVSRLNGRSGLGAIFPAMVNACEALPLVGHDPDSALLREARQSIRDLVVWRGDEAYCQPCVSPVWDTGLTCMALLEDRIGAADASLDKCLDQAQQWLADRQVLDTQGDWAATHPDLPAGGWAFQYRNDHYPDLDDTAVIAWGMYLSGKPIKYTKAIRRAADWLTGMQSSNGGFAAFDTDNDAEWLNQIPFADHGALLDPPTVDVSARVLTLLAVLDRPQDRQVRQRARAYLVDQQEDTGCWFGRWGTNYIYGTWSTLMALAADGMPTDDPVIRRAAAWLKQRQRKDGSWGETNDTYFNPSLAGTDQRGNAAQTAWALLGLMAAGEVHSQAVTRGIQWLLDRQTPNGIWQDAAFNAPGFPRVFYLKYHGYDRYFPYWALAHYRNLIAATHG